MLKRVETVNTTYARQQMIEAIVAGWFQLFGYVPTKESVGVLWAQNSLETGETKKMWNNNVGNVKAVDSPNEVIEYCVLSGVWEIIGGKKVILPPENPGSWFRSFSTLTEGMKHHLDMLKNKRYKAAWEFIEKGDPEGFARKLKDLRYYTATVESYVKAINTWFSIYMADNSYEQIATKLSEEHPLLAVESIISADEPEEFGISGSIEAKDSIG